MANEFVARKGIISLGGVTTPYTGISTTYTVTADDYTVDCLSGTFTVTLPTAVGIEGKIYVIKNSGNGEITVDANGSETIDDQTTQKLIQYESIEIVSDGSNWLISAIGNVVQNFGENRILVSDNTPYGSIAQSGLTFDGSTLRQVTNTSNTVAEIVTGVTFLNQVVLSPSAQPLLFTTSLDFRMMKVDAFLQRKLYGDPPATAKGSRHGTWYVISYPDNTIFCNTTAGTVQQNNVVAGLGGTTTGNLLIQTDGTDVTIRLVNSAVASETYNVYLKIMKLKS